MTGIAPEKIAILDCGAQYTKVIDRRVRELNVATEIFPLNVDPQKLKDGFSGIILSGGPNSVYEEGAPHCAPEVFELNIPVFGICYGMQLINHHFGGTVKSAQTKEYGETEIDVDPSALLFDGMAAKQQVLMSHGDSVSNIAEGFVRIGDSDGTLAAMMDPVRKVYGVQFHPEVELTENGSQMLANFLYKICGLTGSYVLEDRLDVAIADIQKTVGDKNVFVLVSGGVDSTVTAALLLKALGPDKVYAVHIDSGFMRHEESTLVCEALKALGLKHLRRIDAEETFLNAFTTINGVKHGPLKEMVDPEIKRQIIGDVFFYLVNDALADASMNINESFIAQGTLRPDLIESGNRDVSAVAQKIKTHHNDVALIREHREKGLIIEPNRDWHKDEVRQVGRLLGLPEELIVRQPFPGPGLAIRVLCTDQPFITDIFTQTQERLSVLAEEKGFKGTILPVKSVGVQGDGRTYSYLGALTGEFTEANALVLRDLARTIPNKLHPINRVAWVINKASLPATVQAVTPTYLVPETVDKLRRLDHIVTHAFQKANLLKGISQLLTVLVPVDTTGQGGHSVAIRAVMTTDYMTARPATLGKEIPLEFIKALAAELEAQPGVDLVMYDMTSKPPATVEWE